MSTDFDSVNSGIQGENPAVEKLWEKTEPKRAFADAFITLRRKLAMSQEEAARIAGADIATVQRWEAATGPVYEGEDKMILEVLDGFGDSLARGKCRKYLSNLTIQPQPELLSPST